MWAAKLVLENEPYRIRYFHLYDKNARQIIELERMGKEHQRQMSMKRAEMKRLIASGTLSEEEETRLKRAEMKPTIRVNKGDFNQEIHQLVKLRSIRPKQASFCLLDQRTRECDWATVEILSKYKRPGENKVELFYFLAVGWLGRAMAAIKKDQKGKMERYWGRPDWQVLQGQTHLQLSQLFKERFKELGYRYVSAYPIRDRLRGGRIMYYMIHATDHPAAPELMDRAYKSVVKPETAVQLELVLELKD